MKIMSLENFELQQKENWREWYLAVQGFFYFAQGVAMAAISLLTVYMIDVFGLPDEDAVLYQTVIMIPWLIKLLYGLLSDNITFKKFGRRKPYILLAGVFGIIGWFALPSFKTFNAFFLIVGILLSLCIALSDAVLDSLAVDITPTKRRGYMQGVGWGGRGIGMAIAGYTLGLVINSWGWSVGFYIPGGLMIIACFVALTIKEPPIIDDTKISVFKWSDYKTEFTKKNTWIVSLFMLISGGGIAIISTYSTFLKEEINLEIEGIGLGVTFFSIGVFIGALFVGIIGEHLPLFPVLVANTALYIAIIASLIFTPLDRIYILYAVIACLGAINGGYEATQLRISMEYSQGPIAGSMYNWFMSMTNIGQIAIGANIIAQLAEPMNGYVYSMQIASIFLVLALIPAFFLIKWLKKTTKIDSEDTNNENLLEDNIT